jgi:hypothetical protein
MGAGVGSFVAAVLGSKCVSLVMLDGIGAHTRNAYLSQNSKGNHNLHL